MTTLTDYIGTVTGETDTGMAVCVTGEHGQLYAWSHRSGQTWPCSTLDNYERVTALLDPSNGDLLDLIVYETGAHRPLDSEDVDIAGDELTAWIDDNLSGTPWAHLAKSPV